MKIIPPPSPFLDARDLNSRYATQIRKLSNQPWLTDGDVQFKGVDTFAPAHELEPGICADAVNKRFEDGRAWPRNGATSQPWGTVQTLGQNTVLGQNWSGGVTHGNYTVTLSGFIVGQKYLFETRGNATTLATATSGGAAIPVGVPFLATQVTYYLLSATATGIPCTAVVVPYPLATVVGSARFNDPQGFDTQVVLTDDWRDQPGEDGGRGRCWRIQSGNLPVEVPLNGNDIDGTTRALPCFNGLVLLRQGNERHCFGGAAASAGAQIQLNVAPGWVTGDLVLFYQTPNSYFTPAVSSGSVPNSNSRYYVKNITGNKVELYTDAGLTAKINFIGASGKFYLERQAQFPGFYGNGYPPLLAQPNALGETLWDVGFTFVPTAVEITNVATNLVTAPNHGLLPADAIAVTVITLSGGGALPATVYAYPVSDHALYLYDTAIDALAHGATGLQALANNATPANATITKAGASGLPMPSGREGCYFQNRLVIVNSNDTLAISDALDPLHYTPFTAVTANLGESDPINFLLPIPAQDALMIGKANEILLFQNFSQGPTAWTVATITREYGCIAALSAVQVGSDVWFLSRKGVASIAQTVQGISQGVALPVSRPMKKYIDLIDWNYASQACAQYWNNRYYVAVPLKGQQGTRVNNGWLVYNFLNARWEGLWQGAALDAVAMARLNVYGDERLTWVTPAGQVSWLGDGWLDPVNTPIADRLTTRVYTCGQMMRKLHLAAEWTWDSWAPTISATAQTPGINETELLRPSPLVYSNENYDVAGLANYGPNTGASGNPYREDYAPPGLATAVHGQAPVNELIGITLDAHQNHIEGFRCRLDDWGVQFVIANATGSLRIQSVVVHAVAGPNQQAAQV